MFILDTNVISELMRAEPEAAVMDWIASMPLASMYTTSISKGEILYGIMLLPLGKRRKSFEKAANEMFDEDFAGRVLAFDNNAAASYAQIASLRSRAGRPISQSDAQIAAIACSVGGTVVTRNVRDFDSCGAKLLNPWRA
ncbi:MAG: type II toxin-antitoxin system VapC family toxin [Candidatus Obscuribacterales bacterium]